MYSSGPLVVHRKITSRSSGPTLAERFPSLPHYSGSQPYLGDYRRSAGKLVMPLVVVCFCGYFCNQTMPWRSEDFDSYKWVQALKNRALNKHAYVPVQGTSKYLSNANLGDAAKWLGVFVADYLKKCKVTGPFLVVPVPNSDCVASSNTKPRTRK